MKKISKDERKKRFINEVCENENKGIIKNCSNYYVTPSGEVFNIYGKEVKSWIQDTGYKRLVLVNDNKIPVGFYVHRLVASAFLSNTDNKKFVNHIDGNKLNNNLSNLEWVTFSENMEHALRTGLNENWKIRVRCIETGKEYDSIQEVRTEFNIKYPIGKKDLLRKNNMTHKTWEILPSLYKLKLEQEKESI